MTALDKMEAGDDAVQAHTDSGVINIGTIMTAGDVLEIGKTAARTVMLESWPIAERLIDQRIELILERIIHKIQSRDAALFERFKDPRFLGPLVSVERSFAETGDDELGGVLSGLLVDLAAEPIRTRREIVLRESIECAPKLTSRHLNALTVILRLTRVGHPLALNPSRLAALLDAELRPYFDAVPSDSFDYGYMGATQAGTYMPSLGTTVYGRIHTMHKNSMYEPVHIQELATVYAGPLDQVEAEMNEVAQLIEVPYELTKSAGENPTQQVKLKTTQADRILSNKRQVIESLTSAETKFRDFLRSRSLNEEQFTTLIRNEQPKLAHFLDHVASTGALSFQPSPVGLMLARHEMANRSPETAAQVDVMFED